MRHLGCTDPAASLVPAPVSWILTVLEVMVMTLFVGLWTAAPDTAASSRWAWSHTHQISLVCAVTLATTAM